MDLVSANLFNFELDVTMCMIFSTLLASGLII